MEQVPGMLWLAAVMGLLAACAFSFLIYVAVRRARTTEPWEDEAAFDAVLTSDTAGADEHSGAALVSVPVKEPFIEAATDDDFDTAAVEDVIPQATDLSVFSGDDLQGADAEDTDAAAMSAVLSALNAAEPDNVPSPNASPEVEDDWFFTDGGMPRFDNFDPEEDDLVVVWDDADGTEPSVQVKLSDEDPAVSHILLGDMIVAQVRTRDNLSHDTVSLMPFSLARNLGWAHA